MTILGYHVLPEQTSPDQARLQYEDRATEALEDLKAEFESAGCKADHRLVFTHSQKQTIERITDEIGAQAFVIPGMAGQIDRLLVSLSDKVDIGNILSFVESLVVDRDIGVTLFTARDSGLDSEQIASATKRLQEAGIDVQTESGGEDTQRQPGEPVAFSTLAEAAGGHGAVVMGEQSPTLRSSLFGDKKPEQVASECVSPVLVVNRLGKSEM
ncbi:universal stress protein [Salinarchaeum sp. IM2453]|uniref:universal stress protein n=1 Tax=Salinarchaeum sp. IM2453 TaxID=2862870 RepID=UPI00217526FA|nr:universal stress protein [Salinarchaeum sp. IM2453]